MKTNKNKFFKLLHKAISPNGKAKGGKQGHQKPDSYSGKQTRPSKTGGAGEKQNGKSL